MSLQANVTLDIYDVVEVLRRALAEKGVQADYITVKSWGQTVFVASIEEDRVLEPMRHGLRPERSTLFKKGASIE